ncbi:uncharacterized protein BcabD6B2_34110 [Babesia caballi]|uniref:Membrane protein, putative n=1 Tax=Babesia caballi TaxID=5871 RepID=A0AAV4LUX7_BABCB|nr:membrane protein, putative [Babesia caballi]
MAISTLSLLFFLSAPLVSGSGYRTWDGPAKDCFNRGKSSYDDVQKSARDREEECIILQSRDSRLSTVHGPASSPDAESSPFPCLNHLQLHGEKRCTHWLISVTESTSTFDINVDIDKTAGGTREQRVAAEGGCWQFVLNQVNTLDLDRCDIKGEVSRSLIALAKTKCHFMRSGRAFPLAAHGCLLNPHILADSELGIFREQYTVNPCRLRYDSEECDKLKEDIVAQCTNPRVMTESAFQMYHADLNHMDDICFYLQSSEWNRRTESNINRLGESTLDLLNSQQQVKMDLDAMHRQQEESIRKARKLTSWMDTLRSDIKDVFQILERINYYQRKVFDFVHQFKLIFLYLLYGLLAIFFTAFESTAWLRPRIVLALTTACVVDSLAYKVITEYPHLDRLGISSDTLYVSASMVVRWMTGIYCVAIWIKAIWSYQPPAQAMLKEMHQIRRILTPRVVYPAHGTELYDWECSDSEGASVHGYTLEDFVELFGEDSDSTYAYESGYTTDDSYDGSLGEDSEGLVEEYVESRAKQRRRAAMKLSKRSNRST